MISAIINRLINQVNVTNLIGLDEVGTRFKIYPVVVPQEEESPAITVRKASEAPEYCKGELSSNDIRVQLRVYHKDYEGLDLIEAEIDASLQFLRGTYASVVVNNVTKTNSADDYEPDNEEYIRIITVNMRI